MLVLEIHQYIYGFRCFVNRMGGVMVRRACLECEPRSGQTKDYKIGICCYSAQHAALNSRSKDWLVSVI